MINFLKRRRAGVWGWEGSCVERVALAPVFTTHHSFFFFFLVLHAYGHRWPAVEHDPAAHGTVAGAVFILHDFLSVRQT